MLFEKYYKVLSNEKALKVIFHLSYAKTIRELARLTKIPPTTVQNILAKLTKIGKIKFVPDYSYFGLINLAVIVQSNYPIQLRKSIIGTKAVREFRGIGFKATVIRALVPYVLKQKYLEELKNTIDGDIIAVVESKEYISWKPDEDIMVYLDFNRLTPVIDKLFKILEQEKTPPQYRPNNKTPDEIDLKILAGKLAWGPYIRPYTIIKKLNTLENKPIPPKQTISYHYINHVLKGWKYNTYHIYYPSNKIPFMALYLKGPEAPALARALMTFPVSFYAYIDTDQAYLSVQYPCHILNDIFNLTSAANVEAPLGIMTMKLALKSKSPKLWKFLCKVGRRYEWRWPVEAVIKSRN